jgi:hypothetical protein
VRDDWAERLAAPYRDSHERRIGLAMLKCVRLAPTLAVCEALMRGEKVPASALDPDWAKAYGI